ncbi:hypothetical protein TRIATDRAFT_274069 [Trichoderma atroviride IMI 206040]|uniref:HNH nuclease domain-containing protein n=1 Tax=Hypocrea atroviridis (strain ATCC 20476 / IMI 206040) TaxID=452589 RepID=G9NTK9_HYPAI|nr:uncharacterized protein TRIATDRAFT_274069 [Trichoderma atroviride IMI 206040]EHK46050.1 hypothetical protein TRIATDRAFT_274069 [Trichoderma atroviride IMI 206040]
MSASPENNTPESSHTASPEISPHSKPSKAVMPRSLTAARAGLDRARRVSAEIRGLYHAFKARVEPEIAPDQEQPEIQRSDGIKLASLGIELALKEQEEIALEKCVVEHEKEAGILPYKQAVKRRQELNERHISAGMGLWGHHRKRMRFGDPVAVRLMDLSGEGFYGAILALYRKCDGQGAPKDKKKRERDWRSGAIDYYNANYKNHKGSPKKAVWCHIAGQWMAEAKAAHIVPFFMDVADLGPLIFGDRAPSLQQAGNALLLSNKIKGWFNKYLLVVVPVDAREFPITRWKTDIISDNIRGCAYGADCLVDDLDGKELKFLNNNRPVSRFLYFHFIMALVRIRDLDRRGWQDVWARYYTQQPFATPGQYMSKSMLLAIATHQGTIDYQEVLAFCAEQSFDPPLTLDDDESREIARRVHLSVEQAVKEVEDSDEESEESSTPSVK